MIDLTARIGVWLCQLLIQILPDSPLTDLLVEQGQQMQALHSGLVMLNWVVDINGMWDTLVVWLAAIIPFYAGYWSIRGASRMSEWLGNITGMIGDLLGLGD